MFFFKSSRGTQLLFRQLAVLLKSGLSIEEALTELNEFPIAKIRKKLQLVTKACNQGDALIQACQNCPELTKGLPGDIFAQNLPPEKLGMIYQAMADELERINEIRARMLKAAVYPVGVIFFAMQILAILMVFVIPAFEKMFLDFGSQLPEQTVALIEVANNFDVILLWGALVIAVILAFRFSSPKLFHKALTVFPFIGPVLRRSAIYVFAKNLSVFIRSGMSSFEALKSTAEGLDHLPISEKLAGSGKGSNIKETLSKMNYFPQIFLQVIGVGERANSLGEALQEFSNYYEKDVEMAFHRLIFAVEVLAFLSVATVVGWAVTAMYLPIFRLAGTVAG